jgi:hypothetical protein
MINLIDPNEKNEDISSEIIVSIDESYDESIEIDDESIEIDDESIEIDDEGVMEVIKIDDDLVDETFDIDIEVDSKENDTEFLDDEDITLSKHKIQGKHSLKYDSIFKGKKEEPLAEVEFDTTSTYFNENFEVDKGSLYWFESIDNENYIKEKRIKEKVYEVLSNYTDLNFLNNRRKPSKSDFNNYYFLLKTNLKDESFSNVELFNELAVYFSDNLGNMFKLLDNKWREDIINELREHIGRHNLNPEVTMRNLTIGAEVEFEWKEINSNGIKIITGVVKDKEDNIIIVDSYEKIYHLELDQITKILNNNKFKTNLSKLDNIDFL